MNFLHINLIKYIKTYFLRQKWNEGESSDDLQEFSYLKHIHQAHII